MLEIDQVLLRSLLLQLHDVSDVSFRCRIQEPQLFFLSGCRFHMCTMFYINTLLHDMKYSFKSVISYKWIRWFDTSLERTKCVSSCVVSFWHLKSPISYNPTQSSMMVPIFKVWGSTKTEFPVLCFYYLVCLRLWESAKFSCFSVRAVSVCIGTRSHVSASLTLVCIVLITAHSRVVTHTDGKPQTYREMGYFCSLIFSFSFGLFFDELGPFTAEPAGHSCLCAVFACLG